jgi:short-subunit dehydrogenase
MTPDSRVVVITGASGGIGEALALRLGTRGDRLVLAARRRAELERVAGLVNARPGAGAVAVETNVTRRAEVERLRDAALEAFGRIDVWVNNVGRGISRPVLELTDQDFDEMMAVNVKSALYGMQAVVPYFMERGAGHLVNVSSFLGRVPLVGLRSAYGAAKAALNALTANLRADLRRTHPGVHVSLVIPGIVTTAFARNALGAGPGAVVPPGIATGPAQSQSAEEVAEVIARVIDEPAAETYTNPAHRLVVQRYYADVAAFEAEAAERAGSR